MKWAKQYGVNLWSYHLPFVPFDEICISKEETKAKAIEVMTEMIKKASEIGIKVFVIHPSGEPIEEEERKSQIDCAKETLAELAKVADAYGAVLAVENLPRTCLGRNSDEILELISAHPSLRACLDTNHLLSEDIPTFIRKVGKKIITLHVSDYDFVNERHWLPGEGDVDWQALISALKEVGYNGPWNYEVHFEAPETIERRDLTCSDFVENAQTLWSGKKPVAIGKRIANLG